MPNKASKATTDSELVQQLKAASDDNKPVEAVFILRPDDPSQIVPSPERTEELTHEILARVKNQTGSQENRFNIFRNLGSFVISAQPDFLHELIAQPEIAMAMANQQPAQEVIKPVKQRPVRSTGNPKTSRVVKKARTRSLRTKTAPVKSGK